MQRRLIISLVVLAIATLGACTKTTTTSPTAQTSPAAPVPANYVAREFAFEGPSSLPAGTSDITLTNEGAQPHFMVVVRLDKNQDWTAEDAVAYIKAKPNAQPKWAPLVAGAFGPKGAPLNPGESAPVMFFEPTTGNQQPKPLPGGSLEPGSYLMLCFVGDPESKQPHAALGMVEKVTVA